MVFSNTEFYFAEPAAVGNASIIIEDNEAKHISQVMRHKVQDRIYVTDGIGSIYLSEIIKIKKNDIELKIIKKYTSDNRLENFSFFIPVLKSSERFEFALEKCVELGITDFKIFSAQKSYKRGIKIKRWERILLSAMKQSLRAYIPKIQFVELSETNTIDQINLVFDQEAEIKFASYLTSKEILKKTSFPKINLFFGPEAGLTEKDTSKISNPNMLKLNNNRLRSETAIISSATLIASIY